MDEAKAKAYATDLAHNRLISIACLASVAASRKLTDEQLADIVIVFNNYIERSAQADFLTFLLVHRDSISEEGLLSLLSFMNKEMNKHLDRFKLLISTLGETKHG